MELPRALAPWAPLLDLFPAELALALGPLVQRLDLALAVPARSRAGGAEPDGFSGIDRRGSYERLLLSEWLLADAAPDEFIRRASMGEHAFLQLARTEPASSRTAVVLFDSGPNQWGSPRIAHIAALVALARRAQMQPAATAGGAHASLVWGMLHAPADPWEVSVTAESVRRLLRARSDREVTTENLCAWRDRLQSEGGPETADTSDLWIIGGGRLSPLLAAAHLGGWRHLTVRDVLEPDIRRLEATVRGGSATPRPLPILLDLPPDTVCARLIRDPFVSASANPASVRPGLAPHSTLVFAFGGTKLLARAADNDRLIAYPIPNSVRAPAGKAKVYRCYGADAILAAGRVGKTLIMVSRVRINNVPVLRLESANGRLRHLTEGDYVSGMLTDQRVGKTEPNIPLLTCFAAPETTTDLLTLTPDGTLWRLHHEAGQFAARVEALQVEAMGAVSSGVAYVCRLNERRLVITRHFDGTQNLHDLPAGGSRSFFGAGGHKEFGLLACETEPGKWLVNGDFGDITLTPPENAEVAGVAFAPPPKREMDSPPALVVTDPDRRSVSLLSRAGAYRLPRTSSPIVTATASPYGPHIGYATEAGEVFVFSLLQRDLLYRSFVGEGGS